MRRNKHLLILLATLLILLLPSLTESAHLGLERDIQKNLSQSKLLTLKIEQKLQSGEPITRELNHLRNLARNIKATHLLLIKRFRKRNEQVNSLGSKALNRHNIMSQNYLKAIEEYLPPSHPKKTSHSQP